MSLSGLQLTSCYFLTEGLLDNVTVLIGIAYGGRAIAGVINQPFYNYQVQAQLNDVVSSKLSLRFMQTFLLDSLDQEQI